jgi:hypothetical protein
MKASMENYHNQSTTASESNEVGLNSHFPAELHSQEKIKTYKKRPLKNSKKWLNKNLQTCDFEYEPAQYLDIKIYLVSVCGSTLAIISVIENLLLLYLFITRQQFRSSPIYYMMYLAFCDVFVSISYICLMSLHVISEYFQVRRFFLHLKNNKFNMHLI